MEEEKKQDFWDVIFCGCLNRQKKNTHNSRLKQDDTGEMDCEKISKKRSKYADNVSYLSRKSKNGNASEKTTQIDNTEKIPTYSIAGDEGIIEELADPELSSSTTTDDLHEFQKIDYSYLMPSKKILETEPTEYEIMDGDLGFRQIYYAVSPNSEEAECLKQLDAIVKTELTKEGLSFPEFWQDGDYLRFLSMNDNNIKKTAKFIVPHIKFLDSHHNFILTEDAANQFRNGCITILGKNSKGYPTQVWNIKKLENIDNAKCVIANTALKFAICIMKKHCMIGKYCEKFNIVVDFAEQKVPMKKEFIKTMISLLNDNYGTYISRCFLYRPSPLFKVIWACITSQGMIPKRDLESVKFIKTKEKYLFRTFLDPNDTEELYGGNIPDGPHYNGEYWPPRPSTQCSEAGIITQKDILEKKLYIFDILGKRADKTIMNSTTKIEWDNKK